MTDWRGIPERFHNTVVGGDAFELVYDIPDGSIDMILGDPVYWEYDQYYLMALHAVRILRPGGHLILQAGNIHRYYAEKLMDFTVAKDNLHMCPTIHEVMTGGTQQYFPVSAIFMEKPYIWRMKVGAKSKGWMPTLVRGTGKDKSNHEWGDTPAVFKMAIHRLTDPDDIILDPFTGSGTVPVACKEYGRRFVAFEIEPESVAIANNRIALTMEPLIILDERQIDLDLEYGGSNDSKERTTQTKMQTEDQIPRPD